MIVRLVSAALIALFAIQNPASAQVPSALMHAIPPPPVGVQPGAQLGHSVAIAGDLMVVGAPLDDTGASDAGVVKVFNALTGARLHVIPNPAPGSIDKFGYTVAISGTRVIVGVPDDDHGAVDSGTVYVYDLAGATPTLPVLVLNNPTPAQSDKFGESVAIAGTRVVVGGPQDDTGVADSGSVYIYDLAGATPAAPVATLRKPTPAAGDVFGIAVAVSGTRVVVGASGEDAGASNAGRAYVFDLASATPAVPVATLNNPAPAVDDNFGSAVAIFDTRVVVGVHLDDVAGSSTGSAYVYDLASATPPQPVVTLNKPSATAGDQFGFAVAISGMRVLVGTYGDDTGQIDSGKAYVFDLGGPTPTVPVETLTNPSPALEDRFGRSVAIAGSRVAIGAYQDDTIAADSGAVYGYDLEGSTPDEPVVTIADAGPGQGDQFGYSVAVSGTRAVVGARFDDTGAANAGSAYVYALDGATPTTPEVVLNNPSPAVGDNFGEAVSISGHRVVIGVPLDDTGAGQAGCAHVYDLNSATPGLPVFTLNNPSPVESDNFGFAVAIGGQWVAIGVPQDDAGAANAGCVYIYDLTSNTPDVPVRTLTLPNPTGGDKFGSSVAISGTRVVVGAPNESVVASGAGRAYVFDLASGAPTGPIATLNNPSPTANDNFGGAVAISGNRVVVGALRDDTGAIDTGSAYVYEVTTGSAPILVATLNNPTPVSNDVFGSAVAISGTRVIVASVADDSGAGDAGIVYIYDLAGASPTAPLAPLAKANPMTGDRFGCGVAIDGTTVAVGAMFDDTAMVDKGFAYIYGPDVVAPEGGMFSVSPSSPVKAGASLTGNFVGWKDASFPLKYSIRKGSTEIVAPGTNAAPTFTLAEGSHVIHGRIIDVAGNLTDTIEMTIVADGTAPSITLGNTAPRTLISGDPLPNYAAEAVVTDAVGVASVSQLPPAGTIVTFPSSIQVKVVATDTAGNASEVVVPLVVRPSGIFRSVLFRNGGAVPKGGTDTRIPVGAVWKSLGAPAISDTGAVAFLGKWKVTGISAQSGTGIFINDTLFKKVGEAVPGAGTGGIPLDATFKSLKDPVMDEGGHVAFIASIKGTGVKSSNDGVVMSNGRNGALEVIAREGSVAEGTDGAVFKSFTNVSIRGTTVGGTLFTASLGRGPGGAPVTKANDSGAWWLPAGETAVIKLVRKGDPGFASGETIKSFQVLQAISGSTGHGRGQTGPDRAIIQLSLTGGATPRHVLALATPGELTDLAGTGDELGGTPLPSATWKTTNLPSSSADAASIVVLGMLTPDVGEVTSATAKSILVSADSGVTWDPLARIGDPAIDLDSEAVFSGIFDPVGSNSGVAFLAAAKGGNVSASNNDAIWWKPAGGTLAPLAREGSQPPGAPDGAKWKSFTSLALPGGDTGPIFTATLKTGPTSTAERITTKNDFALYAVDAFGVLRELLRENQVIERNSIKTFSLLKAISGSAGVARSFNANRQTVVLVTFTDGSTAIMKIEIP